MTERKYPEIIIFTGIPASGKTTFYQQNFAATHIHISLDVLNTRNLENKVLEETLASGKSCVIDNTNVSVFERAKYIESGKRYGYKVIGYYFRSSIDECRIRNDRRQGKNQVPEVALRDRAAHLERPSMQEGFDELYYVKIVDDKFETQFVHACAKSLSAQRIDRKKAGSSAGTLLGKRA